VQSSVTDIGCYIRSRFTDAVFTADVRNVDYGGKMTTIIYRFGRRGLGHVTFLYPRSLKKLMKTTKILKTR
jgi:hypothetical protein